jgi:hypothetical protein
VTRLGENINAFRVLKRKHERNHLEDVGVDGKAILKGILFK